MMIKVGVSGRALPPPPLLSYVHVIKIYTIMNDRDQIGPRLKIFSFVLQSLQRVILSERLRDIRPQQVASWATQSEQCISLRGVR